MVVLVKLDSPGPVFARFSYVGQNDEIFILFKFRTFDLRRKNASRILRESALDELPQ